MTTKRIACLGPSTGAQGEPLYGFMATVGRYLALAGHDVLTGGFGGAGGRHRHVVHERKVEG